MTKLSDFLNLEHTRRKKKYIDIIKEMRERERKKKGEGLLLGLSA